MALNHRARPEAPRDLRPVGRRVNQSEPGGEADTASDAFDVELKVGRLLRGRALAAAVLLRNLVWVYLEPTTELLAPSWVVVRDRRTGKKIGSLSAGREAGVGEALLRKVQESSLRLTPAAFLELWALRRPPRTPE